MPQVQLCGFISLVIQITYAQASPDSGGQVGDRQADGGGGGRRGWGGAGGGQQGGGPHCRGGGVVHPVGDGETPSKHRAALQVPAAKEILYFRYKDGILCRLIVILRAILPHPPPTN